MRNRVIHQVKVYCTRYTSQGPLYVIMHYPNDGLCQPRLTSERTMSNGFNARRRSADRQESEGLHYLTIDCQSVQHDTALIA